MNNNALFIKKVVYRQIGIDAINVVVPGQFNLQRDGQALLEKVLDQFFGGYWKPKVKRTSEAIILTETKIKDGMKIGLYVAITRNGIEIQFKGFFFLFQNSFERLRYICELFQSLTKEPLYLTGVHLRQDRFDLKDCAKLLPMPSPDVWWSFGGKGAVQTYTGYEGRKKIVTSFLVENSRAGVRCYRKDLEVKSQKNKIKKAAYEKILKGRSMIRIETRIKGADGCKIATHKLFEVEDEESFVRDTLGSWALKHSIRERPSKWSRTPPKSWPLWQPFSKIFFRDNPTNVKWKQLCAETKLKVFKAPAKKINIHSRVVSFIAEMKLAGVTDIVEICEMIANSEDQAEIRLKNWLESRENTIEFLDRARSLRKRTPIPS